MITALPLASSVACPTIVEPLTMVTVPVGFVLPEGATTLAVSVIVLPVEVVLGVTTRVTVGLRSCGRTAVPRSETLIAVLEALDSIERLPVRLPTAVGIKVMLTVQLAPAASVPLHVLDWANSVDAAMEGIVSPDAPVLVMTSDRTFEAAPVDRIPKFTVSTETVSGAGVIVAYTKTSAESFTTVYLLL